MRRSFGAGGGGGMGGGSGGGGGVIRTVRRVVGAGVGGAPPEPFSPSANTTTTTIASANSRKAKSFDRNRPTSPNTALTLSSSSSANGSGSSNNGTSAFSSMINLPTSAPSWGLLLHLMIRSGSVLMQVRMEGLLSFWKILSLELSHLEMKCSMQFCSSTKWSGLVCSFVDDIKHIHPSLSLEFYHRSKHVVRYAFSWSVVHLNLRYRVVGPSSMRFPAGKVAEDTERGVVDEITSPLGSEESFFVRTEPSVQVLSQYCYTSGSSDAAYRMVVSLSSDKAVWDAVLNNEMVKELRGSITRADNLLGESQGKGRDDSNPVKDILSWVLICAKAKIIQLIDTITKLVHEAFQPPTGEKKGENTDSLEGKLKTSLFLSIVVLLIVVITRAQNA
ncbi:hypothetical protein Sango_0716800 [Sesamum angolense]|uniref:Uncharacterized protein n=1 Tax=Sesamum angolense TaxID=2727404 RepID=A0AAE1X2C4_9LAMI|nr:hypothetical protein Sango_0716800 [Sesamum angolense]